MYGELLSALEFSELGKAARGSVWLYPIANHLHVLGAALLVGSILVYDLIVLRRHHELAARISGTALGVAVIGLLALLCTGPILLAPEATSLGRNPAFQVKMGLILIGMLNVAVYYGLRRRCGAERLQAAISAAVWVAVLLCGRLIAYL